VVASPHILPVMVALPLAVAFVLPVAGRGRPGLADWLANLALAALLGLALAAHGEVGVYHLGGWATPIGIDLRHDAFTSLMLLTVNAVALAAGVYSVAYMHRYTAKHHYYSLFLLLVAGMNGVVLAGDLFNLYVFLEVAAVASYALVAFGGEAEQFEASFKYAVLGSLSSTVILIGIAAVYAVTGTLNLAHIAARIAEIGSGAAVLFALGLFVCGFGLKCALAPFHAWLPDAHPAAPAPISALLSGVLVKAIGIYVIARLFFNVLGSDEASLGVLRALGVLSMVVGGLLATAQSDIKRLLAYSSVGQVGYIVLALGLATPLGVVGALYHLLNHACFKSLLFLNAGAVERATGSRDLNRLGGLERVLPVTGVTSLVGSLAVAGIPPFNGFFSKLIIVVACVQAGHPLLAATAVAMSVVTLAYQLKVQRRAFAGEPPPGPEPRGGEPASMAIAMLVLGAGCVALSALAAGGLAYPLLVGPAADALLSAGLAP
jgi:multicomponent Na+:H+ antiporter subunit D